MPLFLQPNDGSHLASIFLSESNRRGNAGHTQPLTKQRFSRTHGAAQRSSDERNDAESSRRAPKKFFYVYLDNLGIPGKRHV